jgi:hypothetical protein
MYSKQTYLQLMYGHHVPLGLGKEPTACKERLNDKGKVDTSEECP